MKSFRFVMLLIAAVVVIVGYYAEPPSQVAPESQSVGEPMETSIEGAVPKKVFQVLETIRRTGQPPEGYVGGRVFQNREHRLPAGGDYREYDVDPHRGGRNAERIVMEWQTKKAWYTNDHYQTFIPLP